MQHLPVPRILLGRFWTSLALAILLLAGCRIESTPARYIDRLDPPEDEIAASREELTDRLLSTGHALQRRSLSDLLSALAPGPEIQAFLPDSDRATSDGGALGLALAEFGMGRDVAVEELVVHVGPRNNLAWFQALYRVGEEPGLAATMRFSGVFVRQEGEWRLVQAHLSRSPSPAAAEAGAGTPGAGG